MATSPTRAILLVDDDDDNLDSLASLLEAHFPNVTIEPFSDPRKALTRAEQQRFDVVVADQRMPDMKGIDLLRQIGRIRPTYRILVTGEAITDQGDAKEKATELLLRKPLDTTQLIKQIGIALGQKP